VTWHGGSGVGLGPHALTWHGGRASFRYLAWWAGWSGVGRAPYARLARDSPMTGRVGEDPFLSPDLVKLSPDCGLVLVFGS
jgi:hypothetical protein